MSSTTTEPVMDELYGLTMCCQPGNTTAQPTGPARFMPVINPGPMVQLTYAGRPAGEAECEQLGTAYVFVTMWDRSGTRMCPMGGPDNDNPSVERPRWLEGRLKGTPVRILHGDGRPGGMMWVFPGLSCRAPGVFRLRFWLHIASLQRRYPNNSATGTPVMETVSDVFRVYAPGWSRRLGYAVSDVFHASAWRRRRLAYPDEVESDDDL